MKEKTVYMETGLVMFGTALTITTTIVMPEEAHFHVAGALVLITGVYAVIARKLPHLWFYGVGSVLIALVTTGYFLYAFATRSTGIRNFFLIFFVEVTLMFCIFFVAFRQIRQLILYNLGFGGFVWTQKKEKEADPELVEFNKVLEVLETSPKTPIDLGPLGLCKQNEAGDDFFVIGSRLSISSKSSVACKLDRDK